jgi:hypothetical protein
MVIIRRLLKDCYQQSETSYTRTSMRRRGKEQKIKGKVIKT